MAFLATGARWGGSSISLPSAIFGSNLKLWLKGDAGITIGTGVSTWADQSGNANNFTQSTGGSQPSQISAGLHGMNTVRFNGSSQYMVGPAIGSLLSASAYGVFLVARPITVTGTPANSPELKPGFIADQGGYFEMVMDTTPRAQGAHYDGADKAASQTIAAATWYELFQWYDGTNINFTVSGSGTTQAAGSITSMTNVMQLGRTGTSNYANVEIAEVVIANAAPTGTQLSQVQAYLYSRWGV